MAESKVDGGGLRLNEGKLQISLVPTSAIRGLAEVLQKGAAKYAPRNWERGMKWSIPYECAMRHLMTWFDGQDLDDETKLNHLKHALCNIAFLIEYSETCPQFDDRPKKKEHMNDTNQESV
jgi:hypothetical protein